MTHQNDAIPPTSGAAAPIVNPGNQRPDEIEQEIGAIRARMDAVIDEIEFRLSPGQMTGGVVEVVRDVLQGGGEGMSGRIARAVRANPVPVALIGIGALWLGWAVARTPEVTTEFDDLDSGGDPVDPPARLVLTGLIAACRDGADGIRRVNLAIAEPALSSRFEALAGQLDRSAVGLEEELRARGGWMDSDGAVHGVWSGLHDGMIGDGAGGVVTGVGGTQARADLLGKLENGLDGTLDLFRDALREPLADHLQVAVGAQFHAIQTARHRAGALREAVA